MKNLQKGFTVPFLIAVVVLILGYWAYFIAKTPTPSKNIEENNYQPQENQNSVSSVPVQNIIKDITINQQTQNSNSTNIPEIKTEVASFLFPASKDKFNRYQVIEVKWQNRELISLNAQSYLYLCTEQKDDCKELLIPIPKEVDSFTWPVGTAYNGDLKIPGGDYVLKLDSYHNKKGEQIKDSTFSGVFTILPSDIGSIKIISPKKGDVVNFNGSFDIKWESRNIENFKPLRINLNMQVPTGVDNVKIWESISNTGFYKWFPNVKENYEVYDGGKSGFDSVKSWLKMPSKNYELRICVSVPIIENIPALQYGNKMYIDPQIRECSDPFLIDQ